jgi:putative RecB family exonuclease
MVTLVVMALPVPASLTPSKVAMFKECALAFRFSVIDALPELPSVQAFKGTVVHRALELLMWEEAEGRRNLEAALAMLDRAFAELAAGPEGSELALTGDDLVEFMEDARHLLRNYFALEDPGSVRVIGTELFMQVDIDSAIGTLRLRGIIDRLELDDDGELVVTDYKTGHAPRQAQEQARLGGVHFYAFLCERLLGKRPAKVQLLHLREPLVIASTPSEESIAGLELQATAIWDAIRRACLLEDFRPRPGPACERCSFHAYCPAMGGDIALARAGEQGWPAQPVTAFAPELPLTVPL